MELAALVPAFGGTLTTIVAFLVALSIIVAVHEYGHYIVARWSGIHADTFSLGFGPVLASWQDKRGTKWQIAALPLGGYVKFLGDADAASGKDAAATAGLTEEDRRRTMHGAPLWARAATVAAGPGFNFLFSALVFALIFMVMGIARDEPIIGDVVPLPASIQNDLQSGDVVLAVDGRPIPELDQLIYADWGNALTARYTVDRNGDRLTVTGPNPRLVVVGQLQAGSSAFKAGMRPGDIVLAIDDTPIGSFPELQKQVLATGGDGRELALTVWRDGETRAFGVIPQMRDFPGEDGWEKRPLIGVSVDPFFVPVTDRPGPLQALWLGTKQVWAVITSSIDGLGAMVTGVIGSCNLQGPIGIAKIAGAAAVQGVDDYIWLIAVISVAIGFLNLFPIPVLDGGHLVFFAWEAISGSPPPESVQRVLTIGGLVLILALMVFALSNDLFCP